MEKKLLFQKQDGLVKEKVLMQAIPSELNAMKYFVASQEWAKINNLELFYFSSFDESWKVKQEGNVGAAWGIWDKNEKLKFELKTDSYVI